MTQFFVGRRAIGVAMVLAAAGIQSASAVEPYQEYRKLIESAQNLTALKDDLFGESVSLYNGQTEFSVTDVSLPGNNALPVEMRRRFNVEMDLVGVGSHNANLNSAGGWEVDVPHITGMFPGANGWAANRCSGHMVPQVPTTVRLTDIWQGNVIHIPGATNRPMLGALATAALPSDGVSRKWATSQLDAIDCIPMKAGLDGEGFRVKTTAGISYHFDTATTRFGGVLRKSGGLGGATRVTRTRIYLLASKVEDPSGNWVQYQYDGNGNPVRIWSSDGREITLAYDGNRLANVSAAGRQWAYGYGVVEDHPRLTSVTLPDGSAWSYSYSSSLSAWADSPAWDGNSTSDCAEQPPERFGELTLVAKHPSGATGQFEFSNGRQYRSGVHASECASRLSGGYITYELMVPNFFDVVALRSKTISGPGIDAPLTWTYAYGSASGGLWGGSGGGAIYPCSNCQQSKSGKVTNPDGTSTVYRYGAQYALNEGRLLGSSVLDASGNTVRTSTTVHMTTAEVAGQPFAASYGFIYGGDDPSTVQVRPVVAEAIEQDGVAYQTTTLAFDALARPTRVNSSSALGTRTDAIEYADNRSLWILGQQAKLTNENTGAVVESTDYDALMRPLQVRSFGRLEQVLTYNGDGTAATVADGRGNVTQLSSWKRGTPQLITFADGVTQCAVVDDNGWVRSVTDENGATTGYGYDAMGRIASIDWPAGDSVAWARTTQSFSIINGDEYGIPAGHWRQSVATGTARKNVYFDAFWRPLVTEEYDEANRGSTQRFQRFAYDKAGRQAFASYLGAAANLTTGTWTEYDALGRTSSVSSDSEYGLLTTTTTYLAGGELRVVDPRGNASTTRFQAFGHPSTESPISVSQQEDVVTEISRDLFGKPGSIVRRNGSGATLVRRNYLYNSQQQLCKVVEPETEVTAMGYDAAGNLAWSVGGLSSVGSGGNSCDVPAATLSQRGVTRAYDARNRLVNLSFPDQNGDQDWVYTLDGKPRSVTTVNDAGATRSVNTFSYNKRGLLTAETSGDSTLGTQTLGYGYSANGALAGITYPSGRFVDYAPNGLGQPTRAGNYATAVSYYPNGGMRQFTYGNGIVHSMTQNARQLPERVSDSNGAIDGTYSYDATGNVTAIVDHLDQAKTRSMSYDGLDRLISVQSQAFGGDGVFRYSYDAVDNMRSATLGGVKDHHYWYDANNRLTNVQTSAGATSIGLTYDVQGNLSAKNGVKFAFDFGNRLRSVAGLEKYRYDSSGRRILATAADGSGEIRSLYGNDGVLRRQDNGREGTATEYIHLNGSLIAEVVAVVVPTVPALTVTLVSNRTAVQVAWSSASQATRYELRERVGGKDWVQVYSGSALEWRSTTLGRGVVGYAVRACFEAACSGWSSTVDVSIGGPPVGKPAISVHSAPYAKEISMSWGAVNGASSYQLYEIVNGGFNAKVVQDGANLTAHLPGKADARYTYVVYACNEDGCGPESDAVVVDVLSPPSVSPSISVPTESLDGRYVLQYLSGSKGATQYVLEERLDAGPWIQIQATLGFVIFDERGAGTYSYRVRGRNEAGWGPYSEVVSIVVIRPPTAAVVIGGAASSNTGSALLSWPAVPGATAYDLYEAVNGGSFTLVQRTESMQVSRAGMVNGTYVFYVRACNRTGCGPRSAAFTVVSTPPPTTPQFEKNLQTRWRIGGLNKLRCEVQWTASVGATSYQLQVPNGVLQYDGPATSLSSTYGLYCAPSHVIRACNASGCSPWSDPPRTQGINDLGTLDEGDTGVPR